MNCHAEPAEAPYHCIQRSSRIRVGPALQALTDEDICIIIGWLPFSPQFRSKKCSERLESAEADSRILEKDISVIDLRLPDRMIITPTPAAQARARQPKEGI